MSGNVCMLSSCTTMDMPRLGLGFLVQKRTMFLSSCWWGFFHVHRKKRSTRASSSCSPGEEDPREKRIIAVAGNME